MPIKKVESAKSVRKSFAISITSKYILLAAQFVSISILARLLTPEDVGIYSIAASVVAFGHLIRNFGINQFIIQEKELTNDKIKAAFTLTLIISWSAALVLFFGSDYLANFYNNNGISNILKLLSINFVLLPFSSIPAAYLRRNMDFFKISIIEILSGFVAVSTAITSAVLGAKYYSMAFAANAEILTTIIVTQLFRPKGLPFLPGVKKLKYVFLFGSKIGLSNIIVQFSNSMIDLLVGRFLGLSSVGLYSRAYGAFMLFEYSILQGIRPVILPLFSQAVKNKISIKKTLHRSIEFTSAFSLPFYFFLFLFTKDVVHVLYGDQWDQALPIIKILCIAGAFISITAFFDQIMISQGKVNIVLRFRIFSVSYFFVLLIHASVLNLSAVAWAFSSFKFLELILAFSYFRKYLSINIIPIIRIYLKLIFFTISSMLPAIIIFLFCYDFFEPYLIRLVFLMSITIISWIASVFIFNHPLSGEIKTAWSKLKSNKTNNKTDPISEF